MDNVFAHQSKGFETTLSTYGAKLLLFLGFCDSGFEKLKAGNTFCKTCKLFFGSSQNEFWSISSFAS